MDLSRAEGAGHILPCINSQNPRHIPGLLDKESGNPGMDIIAVYGNGMNHSGKREIICKAGRSGYLLPGIISKTVFHDSFL